MYIVSCAVSLTGSLILSLLSVGVVWGAPLWSHHRPCAHFSHMAHCTEVRFAIFLSGGFTNTAVINPPETKLAKRTSVHCRGLVPKDRRSFLPRWEVGHEEGSDFCSAPLRGHIPFSFIALYSTMEEDRNLGSLLPARCCCKAHASTGSSLSLSSSSDSYIVIKSPGTLYPWVFLIVFLLLDGVIAGEGSLLLNRPRLGVGVLDSSPLQSLSTLMPSASLEVYPFMFLSAVGSYVLLVALFHFVSSGCVSEMGLVGVLWLWITMSWSSSVCSPLLLFDAWRLLLVISHSLLLVCNLDIVIQTVVSGFTVSLWLPMSVVCDRLLFFWDFALSGCSASLSDFCRFTPFVANSATCGSTVVCWLRRGKVRISFARISMGSNISVVPISRYSNLASASSRGGIVGDGNGSSSP